MAAARSGAGRLHQFFTRSGLRRWYIDIEHKGLNKCRRITGDDPDLVCQKANAQMAAWDEMAAKKEAAEAKRKERAEYLWELRSRKELAEERAKVAQEAIRAVEGILAHTLSVDDLIDWDTLRDHSEFSKPRVFPKPEPAPPAATPSPPKPSPVAPKTGLLERLFPSLRKRAAGLAESQNKAALRRWHEEAVRITRANQELQKQCEAKLRQWQAEQKEFFEDWEAGKQAFLRRQEKKNQAVDKQMAAYGMGVPGAIVDYCDLVLSRSRYPDAFPQSYELDYNPETKTLIVEYQLPSPVVMPKVKEVKYVQSRDEFKETLLSEVEQNRLYDSAIYQIALRTIHELFEADAIRGLEAVVLNGWVTSVASATGQEVTACIVSIHVRRQEFMAIDLARVDPKACFKALKGVGSSKLHSLAAVPPILQIDREDRRFVAPYQVADELEEGYNIAVMDWQDFEHLIRELFEKEFAAGGGEVKVTRASRDGGVDAVAFDPDPLRGGKIVIQAKRYTNTVGVAAVRDLYGTVVNEGATKGILVSTSDYGPDAYEFAKDKPLTLLNGAHLLHLLEKHGHKARIDLREAKRILAEKEKGD